MQSRRGGPGRIGVWKLLSIVALATTGLWLGSAGSVLGYQTCPSGWTQVTTTQIGHLTEFCKKSTPGGPMGTGTLYFLKAARGDVGQALMLPGNDPNHPWGSPSNPDPQYQKQAVWQWEQYLRGYWGIQITINGDFFDSTSGGTSAISYPIFQTAQLVEAAKNPGSDASHRRCLAFGSTYGPTAFTWSYAYSDWTGVSNYGNSNCSTSSPYHRIVGLEPTWFPGGDTANALTMVGTSGTSLCFLVGGWQTRSSLATTMSSSFGCTAALQLDGGHSTQLSYWDQSANFGYGQYMNVIEGYFGEYDRPVPHVIAIW